MKKEDSMKGHSFKVLDDDRIQCKWCKKKYKELGEVNDQCKKTPDSKKPKPSTDKPDKPVKAAANRTNWQQMCEDLRTKYNRVRKAVTEKNKEIKELEHTLILTKKQIEVMVVSDEARKRQNIELQSHLNKIDRQLAIVESNLLTFVDLYKAKVEEVTTLTGLIKIGEQ